LNKEEKIDSPRKAGRGDTWRKADLSKSMDGMVAGVVMREKDRGIKKSG